MSFEVANGELELSSVQKLSSVSRRYIAGPDTVRDYGDYFVAIEPNSFGLPAIETCPGMTDECKKDCYAIDSERRTATHEKMQENLDILEEAKTVDGMYNKLRTMVAGYRTAAERLGIPEDKRNFRVHWDGDFYSEDYAEAWRKVIEESPEKYWIYTRSFTPEVNVVPILAGLENLDLFMSVDCQNVDRAAEVLTDKPKVRVAYLVDYAEDAEPLMEKLGRTRDEGFHIVICPENIIVESGKRQGQRRQVLIDEKGGACAQCKVCFNGRENWDVVFVKNNQLFRPQPFLPFVEPIPVDIKPRQKKTEEEAPFVGTLALTEAAPSLLSWYARTD
ncbi:MAG TPA: hypothetical protein VLE69_02785 [Candidatus Saccharimonadales bacterium]|nr:hypothetical protein [Candidatus Saccharimonadales bacterium]